MAGLKDWSAQHSRLGSVLLALSAIMFVLARLQPSPSEETVAGLAFAPWWTRDMMIFWLSVIFVYLFIYFIVRTRAEQFGIASQSAKLNRTLQWIHDIRKRTDDLVRSFSGALIGKRLEIWDRTLGQIAIVPQPSDLAMLDSIATKLKLFDAVTDRIETVLENLDGSDDLAPSHQSAEQDEYWKGQARALLELLGKMDEIGRSFDRRKQALTEALDETRAALQDARHLLTNEGKLGTEDLHTKLAAVNADLKLVQRDMRSGRRAFLMDRYLFSVRMPQLISVVLVLLSFDAIMRGGAQTADAIAAFFSTIAMPS